MRAVPKRLSPRQTRTTINDADAQLFPRNAAAEPNAAQFAAINAMQSWKLLDVSWEDQYV